jgi:mRNA-degrading endonuclease YafQ of YafQ-DinJ toxin-antitoxin module
VFSILYTQSYNKRAARFLKKHPEMKEQYRKTLMLLEANPYHPSLRLHRLQGKLNELHSISVNLSVRITIYFMIQEKNLIPVDIGDHDTVYK